MKLITYPDSLGGNLQNLLKVLDSEFSELFDSVHVLPPFPSSGDRGFAPINYKEIEPDFGTWEDLSEIAKYYDLTLDLMVNHVSAQSPVFKDYLANGENSKYKDFFITPEQIYGKHDLTDEDLSGVVLRRKRPYSDYTLEDGKEVRIWTTFGAENPSEQIDLNVNREEVREYFLDLFAFFNEQGVKMLRMDAIAYAIKREGSSNFFVEPEIYDFMNWIEDAAKSKGLEVLHEIHAPHDILEKMVNNDYKNYDFLLPYAIVQSILLEDPSLVYKILSNPNRPSNWETLIDCHDGIPVQPDMNGLLDLDDMVKTIDISASRGAKFSELRSVEKVYKDAPNVHQICGTLYSLFDENDDAQVVARAIQLFTPGEPQVYYEGLLSGVNDTERYEKTNDPRELNRRNYSLEDIREAIQKPVVQRLFKLIKVRNSLDLAYFDFTVAVNAKELELKHSKDDVAVIFTVDLTELSSAKIKHVQGDHEEIVIL